MTIVINLLGGSGIGKTTARMLTTGAMKSVDEQTFRGIRTPRKIRAQEVGEFVKSWADIQLKCTHCGEHHPRVPTGYDQAYLFGCQSQAESILYGNYEVLVTDSPMLLSGYYEFYHLKKSIVLPSILNFIKHAEENGVTYLNFMLSRHKEFDPQGRFETAEQASFVDNDLERWMNDLKIPLIKCTVEDVQRPKFIIDYLEEFQNGNHSS